LLGQKPQVNYVKNKKSKQMKTKYVVIIFLLSVLFSILGMLGKVYEWIYSENLILLANGLWVLGIILGLIKLLTHKKLKEIMNQ